ncbi:S41 family peptidase [Stenotrophomonas sp.]|uniref:S41 family peptidase n=1 Tax=Stenotrophomonas sp. TaxID=69392 RepID=UPI002FC6FB83
MPIARCGWVMTLALTVAGLATAQEVPRASPAVAAEVPSAAAQAQMLQLLQQQSLYRDRVDWSRLRADLAAATDATRQRALLDAAIRTSSDGHGRWISAQQLRNGAGHAKATQAAMQAAPETSSATKADGGPTTQLGWIAVDTYLNDHTQSRAQINQASTRAAIALQARIRDQDDGRRCGWIVDLRGNRGGNMWPMLLGVGPLLGDARGADPVGMFLSGGQRQPWAYRDGAAWVDNRPVVGSRETAYALRQPGAPVAVLFGARTASSGEALVLAFRGRLAARSFGQPSAGFSTANTTPMLADGSLLLLTRSVSADRTGAGDGHKLQPDVTLPEGEDAAVAARAWLLAQPACKAP